MIPQRRTGQRLEEAASSGWSWELKQLYNSCTHPYAWMRPTAQEAAQRVQAHLDQLLCAVPLAPDPDGEDDAGCAAATMAAAFVLS